MCRGDVIDVLLGLPVIQSIESHIEADNDNYIHLPEPVAIHFTFEMPGMLTCLVILV